MEVSRVAFRIQKELVKPLRELDITDKEFTCLRTIVFFAPGRSLNTSSVLCRHKHGYCQEHLASFFQSVQTTWFHNGREREHINVGLLWFCWQINSGLSFEPSTYSLLQSLLTFPTNVLRCPGLHVNSTSV